MRHRDIKVGGWYDTNVGFGRCETDGRTYPFMAYFDVVRPISLGRVEVAPRDVKRKLSEAEAKVCAGLVG